MSVQNWPAAFGEVLASGMPPEIPAAKAFAELVSAKAVPGLSLVAIRQHKQKTYESVEVQVDVERPQDLRHPIKATEAVAVIFASTRGRPSVLALRDDFPDTPHQNAVPPGMPASLCIDDRPWSEAKLTYTPMDLARRIQLWLAKAARGELHDRSLPPEPLFFPSALSLIMPPGAITADGNHLALVGSMRADNKTLVILEPASDAARARRQTTFTVIQFKAQPQKLSRMRHASQTLAELSADLSGHGIDLERDIKVQLREWASAGLAKASLLASRLILLIAFPVVDEKGGMATDLRAFITLDPAGKVGELLGCIFSHRPIVGGPLVYAQAITATAPKPVQIEPGLVYLAFHRELAARIAGHAAPDSRRAVLVGAGALGSQLALTLGREGKFKWTVIDYDTLLPHNLARHGLLGFDIGAYKALALGANLTALMGEPADSIVADFLEPGTEKERVDAAIAAADVIIDASASIAVARRLADLAATKARRVCTFFNPAGTAVIVLAEPADHSVTLHDLEAQYYRLALTGPSPAAYLQPPADGVSYSGSCRSLTNRIPAANAALLSALAARGIDDALKDTAGSISVWIADPIGNVVRTTKPIAAVHASGSGWRIIYNDDLLGDLKRLRAENLPRETGGVLLGIVDTSRKTIHLAHALPAPPDSTASTTGFERGVAGLLAETRRSAELTQHQLKYVGEWHSHPDRASVLPSGTDLSQLVWLQSELENEGVPAIMAIAGQNGRFSFLMTQGLAWATPSSAGEHD